jgi:hypothetical protein
MADLDDLIRDLTIAATAVGQAMRPALQASAQAIKEDWQNTWPWSGTQHLSLRGGGPSLRIGFETKVAPFEAYAEIGVNRGDGSSSARAGKLAHLIEFGSVNNAPHPGGGPALAKQVPVFTAAMLAIGQGLLVGATAIGQTSVPSRFNRRASGDAWPGF